MKNLTIARRYAKALLLIGKENGQTEKYREELESFTMLLSEQKSLEAAINNPLYDTSARKKVLEKIVEKLELSDVVCSFLLLLFDKGRIGFIGSIYEFYKKFADELKGVVRAGLVSATPLSSDAVEKIKAAISNRVGKQVILDVEQDPSLIGGIVTKIGDLVLDGSIKTQLLNMRETLKRGESA